MKLHKYLKSALFSGAVALLAFACTPENPLEVTAPSIPHFTASTEQLYLVADTEDSFTVQIGVTNQTGSDQAVSISVDESSTALENVHYTLSSTSVTVPNGEYVASFTVTGDFEQLGADGDQTLVLNIASPAEGAGDLNQSVTIVLSQFCEYSTASMAGTYTLFSEFWNGSWSVVVEEGDAADQLVIRNMYQVVGNALGFGGDYDVVVNISQDGPLDFSGDVPSQVAMFAQAGDAFSQNYGDLSVVGGGPINTCGELELTMTFTVGAGSFGSATEVLVKQ